MGKTWCLPLIVTVLLVHQHSCAGRELPSLKSASTDYVTDRQLHNSKTTVNLKNIKERVERLDTIVQLEKKRLQGISIKVQEYLKLKNQIQSHDEEKEGFGMDTNKQQEIDNMKKEFAALKEQLQIQLSVEEKPMIALSANLREQCNSAANIQTTLPMLESIQLNYRQLLVRVESVESEQQKVKESIEEALGVTKPISGELKKNN